MRRGCKHSGDGDGNMKLPAHDMQHNTTLFTHLLRPVVLQTPNEMFVAVQVALDASIGVRR